MITSDLTNRRNIKLVLATGILFGISFPPFPLGIIACVSLVPLLFLYEFRLGFWKTFRLTYSSFFIGSLISLYWVGGFTHAKDPFLMLAGLLLLLWTPLFFTLIMSVYYLFRNTLRRFFAVLLLPFIWITGEWLYALGEFAFPWLVLGNTQTYDLARIQFIEYTGVYGASLWVLGMNVFSFLFLLAVMDASDSGSRRSIVRTGILLILFLLLPYGLGWVVSSHRSPAVENHKIAVGIIQPNTDPWEKWKGNSDPEARWGRINEQLTMSRELIQKGARIIIWPETAILCNLPMFGSDISRFRHFLDSTGASVVSGYIRVEYYPSGIAPVASNRIKGTSIFYDSYNAILFIQPRTSHIQQYSKMRLVPFAERIPYAEKIPFLIEPLRWNVGVSNWGKGTDSTIFEDYGNSTAFSAMVCYESIFPEFVASYVNKHAQFLVFITNDSWWGNTSGARQHFRYAIMRAIENRRWIVRCANGGISGVIAPSGEIISQTEMHTRTKLLATIAPLNELTFYAKHGDYVARYSGMITLFGLGLSVVMAVIRFITGKKHHDEK